MKLSSIEIKRFGFKVTCSAIALVVSFASLPTLAAVPNSFRQPVQYFTYGYSQPSFVRLESASGLTELDLSYIRQLSQMARNELNLSVADFIPSNLKESQSEGKVARQIIGHSLERWFSNSEILQGTVGEAIRSIEEPMAHSMNIKDSSGTNHKVQFNVKAARAIASVTYTGYLNATVAYQATSQTLGVEVSHQIDQSQKVVLSHTTQPEESRQLVAWQMSW